jgi:hypothetical protein
MGSEREREFRLSPVRYRRIYAQACAGLVMDPRSVGFGEEERTCAPGPKGWQF